MAFYPFAGGTTSALRGSGTQALVGVGTTGDAFNRLEMDADGGLRGGSGAAAVDSTFIRTGVNQYSTPALAVGGGGLGANVLAANGSFQTSGNVNVGFGSVDILNAGNGLKVAEGSNAKQGVATLVAGTVIVANTSVTANSRILLTTQTPGGTAGFLVVSARTPGTSFTILSSNAADTSVVAYEIFEPG